MNNNFSICKNIPFNKLFESADNIEIIDYLKKDYTYIYEEILRENFLLKITNCDIFYEIGYENKVVGFATFNIINDAHVILTQIYILKSFRGRKLFKKLLEQAHHEGFLVSILEPNRDIIKCLINYNYAEKINESLVLSAINFRISVENSLYCGNIRNNSEKYFLTNLYDWDMCTPLNLSIASSSQYNLNYIRLLDSDKKYISEADREKINEEYVINIVSLLLRRDFEIERRLLLLKNNLPSKEIDLKEIFSSKKLNPLFQQYVDKNLITYNEAKSIRQQLFIDFTRSSIRKNSIELRLNYLVNQIHKNNKADENVINPCPYCGEELDFSERYCINCGNDIFNDLNTKNRQKFLFEEVLNEKQSYKYSLFDMKEKIYEFDEDYQLTIAFQAIINNLSPNNYPFIFEQVALHYGLDDYDLQKIMQEKGYLSFEVDESDWNNEAQEYTLNELKKILKDNNQKQSGNKSELIERIRDYVPFNIIQSKIPKITRSAYELDDNTFLIIHHHKYLKKYVFEEFKNYYESSPKTEIIGITLDFLEEHIQYAMKNKNHDQLIDSIRRQFLFYLEKEDLEEMIRLELKAFLVNVNMLYIDKEYYNYYEPVQEITFKNLQQFKYQYDFEEMNFLLRMIYNSFDENDLKISLDEISSLLYELINQNSLDNLNRKIRYNYYSVIIKNINNEIKTVNHRITTLDKFFN